MHFSKMYQDIKLEITYQTATDFITTKQRLNPCM